MNKDDLIHLLQDSIEKAQKTRIDTEIRGRCLETKKFMDISTKHIEESESFPARQRRELKFQKDEIN